MKLRLTPEEIESGAKTEVFCNKCGMSCRGHIGNLNGLIEQKVCFNGLVDAKVCGGYDSTHLKDGDIVQFSLCERCLVELISTFQLSSHFGNYLFPEPYTKHWDEISEERKWSALGELDDEEIVEFFRTCERKYLEDRHTVLSALDLDEHSERSLEVLGLLKKYLAVKA